MTKRQFLGLLSHTRKLGVEWTIRSQGYIETVDGANPLAIVHELVFGDAVDDDEPAVKTGAVLGLEVKTMWEIIVASDGLKDCDYRLRLNLLAATGLS